MTMLEWQLDINCPLCGVKFGAKRAQRHHKKNHSDIEMAEFIALIRTAVERGDDVLDTKRVVKGGSNPSGKSAFCTEVRNSVKYISIVPGGAIGLGKKK